ncbi:hypothetical protein Gohar_021288 [Gossypium harknessii]|uniref:DUF4283 domain-containing protein n=1 Tax=Gossypium harknessii TaxID=34285 RepID=A0A7J9I7X4_9ROSI|nr:hypothetical protein [Gossypium harknessii]
MGKGCYMSFYKAILVVNFCGLTMEDAMSNLRLLDDEEEAIQEVEGAVSTAYQFCLVGRCLTDGVIHFPSLRNTMADLWHPIEGICITELGEKRSWRKFFPFRLQIEPSKIVFGWDLSLHAVVRYRNTAVSRWLRAANETQCITENLASVNQGISINEEKVLGRNFRGVDVNQNINPNLIPLGSGQYCGNSRLSKGRNGGNEMLDADRVVYGAIELVLNEEDDPIALVEGKKWQRIVESSRAPLDAVVGPGYMDVSASSGDQSSWAQ